MRQPKPETFGKIITDEQASQYFGFVYSIEVCGRKYLGQKSFNRGVDWRTYTSSNKEIQNLLKTNEGNFRVLAFARDKRELTYKETSFLFKFDVLEDDTYCNGNILGKFYRRITN